MDEPDDLEAVPPHEVINFFCGQDIDSEFSIVCRGHRFLVTVSADSLHEENQDGSSSLEAEYQRLLAAVTNDDPTGLGDLNPLDLDPVDAMYDWITASFCLLFRALPPLDRTSERLQTLEAYSNPPTSHFTLKSVHGQLTPVPILEPSASLSPLVPSRKLPVSLIRHDVPAIPPEEILIPWDSLSEGASYPRIVLHKGQKFYLKSAMAEPTREVEILHRIRDARLHDQYRIPKLYAYVKHESEDRIIGLLFEYLDDKGTLDGIYAAAAPLALREGWYKSVADTIAALHAAGIIWGDVKADNVLIDQDDHAWVIDFGGGYTEGCVDKDKMETVAGDLQGLSSIKARLKLGQGITW